MDEKTIIELFKIWLENNPGEWKDKSVSEIISLWFKFKIDAHKELRKIAPEILNA